MCNLANTIHTSCLHNGGLLLRSRCTKGLFSGRLTGCDDSITEGITYVPSLCAGCAYRSSLGRPVTSITFRALDGTVMDLTSVQLGQRKKQAIAAKERVGEGEEVKLLTKQQRRRERLVTRRKSKVDCSAGLEILAFKRPKLQLKLIPKLETILEVDEIEEVFEDVHDSEQESESLSCSTKSSSTRSCSSITLCGSSSAAILQAIKTDQFEERYGGANEAENAFHSSPKRSPASMDSAPSIVSFGFAVAVELRSVKVVEIEISKTSIMT